MVIETLGQADAQLVKQRFLFRRRFRDPAEAYLAPIRGGENDVCAVHRREQGQRRHRRHRLCVVHSAHPWLRNDENRKTGDNFTKPGHGVWTVSVLYRWRDAYRKEGAAGLERPPGRPPGVPNPPRPAGSSEEAAARRVAELERKIGQQALDIDFLRRAFKRVKESRRKNIRSGATASTERSEA